MSIPRIKNVDSTFWVVYILLIIVAVVSLFSASSSLVYKGNSIFGPIGTQIIFFLVGIVIAFGTQLLPTKIIRLGGYLLLGVSVLCLYSLLIPGNPLASTVNGATRWIRLGGITFQPSELAKLSLVIVVADLLSRIRSEKDKKKYFFETLVITIITTFPIFPYNLSTTILICGIVFLLWILARIPFKYTGSVAGVAVICLVLGYCFVEFIYVRPQREIEGPFKRAETWVKRIDRKLYAAPEATAKFEITDQNMQEVYAKVAIARGGASPLGVFPGNSKERDYLPLAFMDYIFAIIVEETGIIGAFCLSFLYVVVLFRACKISTRYADYAAMLMVMGLALMLTCQALISMMVAVGLGPVTGQPLPMISRGGTGVIITSIYFGIMMCVSREQRTLRDRQDTTTRASAEDVPEIL